ncbi:hypothetical protein AMTR_s00005p00228760 [Amborella trichopoda]|uniref:Protein kinase domain-containing protein n=1 Tax=Amborella trichopoda TaxID=13333 RepID=W1PI96_AMBTC|nr:hypothetical protein AMTR_s00005p00228760 [Amborella trichopoda]
MRLIGVRRLTMDYDGNLRLYSLDEATGLGSITWLAMAEQCRIHGLCGRNGICTYKPQPTCACPPYYEASDPKDWTKGCIPKSKTTCDPLKIRFIELPQTDYGYDINYTLQTTFEACRNRCLDDCTCQGFMYRIHGDGGCYFKSALFNGYTSTSFPGSMYIKVAIDVALNHTGSQNTGLRELELRCPTGAAAVTEGLGVYGERKSTTPVVLVFECNWLQEISKKSLERGLLVLFIRGLSDGRVVEVKRLHDVRQGEQEFWPEVSTIGMIYHKNLVRMWGFCAKGSHKLLFCEYLENGSLDKHLFLEGTTLDWNQRLEIALGIAKGPAYLHHECLEWVLHCDVKPENILLDAGFEPKITDFGLAKLLQRRGEARNNKSISYFRGVRGAKGYMGPETTLNLPITTKADVYSYGVVLLEMVRGR